ASARLAPPRGALVKVPANSAKAWVHGASSVVQGFAHGGGIGRLETELLNGGADLADMEWCVRGLENCRHGFADGMGPRWQRCGRTSRSSRLILEERFAQVRQAAQQVFIRFNGGRKCSV